MVLLLQLCIFALALFYRGRLLTGKHLTPRQKNDSLLHHIYQDKHGIISVHHIGIERKQGIPFTIKRERWYHRLLKLMGLASEISVAHPEFNGKFFIITDYPDHLKHAFESKELLPQIQALFALPVKSLHATHHKIWCALKRKNQNLDNPHYKEHQALLQNISRLTTECPLPTRRHTKRLGKMALSCIAVHAGLLAIGIWGFLPTFSDNIITLDPQSWIIKGLIAGLVLSGIWLVCLFFLFRGSSWICWVLVDFVLIGVVSFMLSGIFLIREANIHLPQREVQTYSQPILQRMCIVQCRKGYGKNPPKREYRFYSEDDCQPSNRPALLKKKKYESVICQSRAWFEYSLSVHSPWQRSSPYTFSVSETLFDSTSVNGELIIPVNTGIFRIQWIDTDSIKPYNP